MNNLIIQQGAETDSPISIFIMGATATGKTDLALSIYDELGQGEAFDLISVDSALVYRGMDIGTAKPDAQILSKAPHALIDIIDPADVYSAGQFRQDALRLMQNSVEHQRRPILVGGTMLYFNALQKGMADMPEVDEQTRQAIADEAISEGTLALHKRLQKVDPVSAERIHPNDPQRIKRALELYDFTGKTLTEYWQEQDRNRAKKHLPYRCIKIALMPDDRI
jgi:tRNA dimethylallyltransferase